MKKFLLHTRQFLVSEDGPTAVEYAVMLALIIIVCLTAIGTIGTNANTTFTNVGNSIGSSPHPARQRTSPREFVAGLASGSHQTPRSDPNGPRGFFVCRWYFRRLSP